MMGSDLDTFTGQFGTTLHRLKLIPDHDKLAPVFKNFRIFMGGIELDGCDISNFEFHLSAPHEAINVLGTFYHETNDD